MNVRRPEGSESDEVDVAEGDLVALTTSDLDDGLLTTEGRRGGHASRVGVDRGDIAIFVVGGTGHHVQTVVAALGIEEQNTERCTLGV